MEVARRVRELSALVDTLKFGEYSFAIAKKIFLDESLQPDHADAVFLAARDRGQHRDIYEYYLSYFAKRGEIKRVNDALHLAKQDDHLQQDWIKYLPQVHAVQGLLDSAWGYIDRLRSQGLTFDDPIVLSDVIRFSGRDPAFVDRAHELLAQNGDAVAVTAWSEVLRTYWRQGEVERATEILQTMLDKRLKPDQETMKDVLKGLYKHKGQRSTIIKIARNHRILQDPQLFTLVIKDHVDNGHVADAEVLFRQMVNEYIQIHTNTVNILIGGFAKHGDAERALVYLDYMKRWELKPDLNTYVPILQGLGKQAKTVKPILQILKVMSDNGYQLDAPTYNLISGHVGHVGFEVMDALQGMLAPGVTMVETVEGQGEEGDVPKSKLVLFTEEQQRLIDMEEEASKDQFKQRSNMNEHDRVRLGFRVQLRATTVKTEKLGTKIDFSTIAGVPMPPTFAVRDLVVITKKSQAVFHGIVEEIHATGCKIAVEEELEMDELEEGYAEYFMEHLYKDITWRRMNDALVNLSAQGLQSGPKLKSILFGTKEPTFNEHKLKEDVKFFSESLNDLQKDVIKFCLAANDVALIHGPPGTGKSTVVVEFLRQVVERGERVLMCGPSNTATDNVLSILSKRVGDKFNYIRIGHTARVLPELHKYTLSNMIAAKMAKQREEIKEQVEKENRNKIRGEHSTVKPVKKLSRKKIEKQILERARIVFATNTGFSNKDFGEDGFDWVVIDEAAQGLELSCWIPILHGRKVLLAGDHNQLPPTILSMKAAEEGLEDTLFEKLTREYPGVVRQLTTQYRMHKKIMAWPSKHMYANALLAHSSVSESLLHDMFKEEKKSDKKSVAVAPTEPRRILQSPIILIDTSSSNMPEAKGVEMSIANEGEVNVVEKHIKALLEAGIKETDIGVMTPYSAQETLLKKKLEPLPGVEVSTVDGFQGREKEVILISMVRSNPAPHELGFLSNDRRMNVAITRGRRHICLICDAKTISAKPSLKSLVEFYKEFGVYLDASDYLKKPFNELVSQEQLDAINAKEMPAAYKPVASSTSSTSSSSQSVRPSNTLSSAKNIFNFVSSILPPQSPVPQQQPISNKQSNTSNNPLATA